ncbi:hypothetical protein [Nocardia blacklockiae]|uniref:hypothetical protein n=1 Tax=Nocardia blacklockiae TaxID=480036 RepID=UPI001894E0FA|nr:hypothetical protein [Nocardia blacklockiae]MBF6175157.1 hypothetical protein [Nocardia blacklockiae]
MNRSQQVSAGSSTRFVDPVAVAIANASLLGAGYLMLRRRRLVIGNGLITGLLVLLLAEVAKTVWFEVVVVVWCAAVVMHGWHLASARPREPGGAGTSGLRRRATGRHMLVAVAITAAVWLAIGLVRAEDTRIEQIAAAARGSGDCAAALGALDNRWIAHYVADAPLAARGDLTVRACRMIGQSAGDFRTVLETGDSRILQNSLDRLSTVLTTLPGHQNMVATTLDEFLRRLPTDDACRSNSILQILSHRPLTGTVLDHTIDTAARLGPAAVVACQLATVRGLLKPPTSGTQPRYCSDPQPYSAATPYGSPGPNRALLFGNDADTNQFPPEWRAHDAADAVVVICAAATAFGAPVQTCPYKSNLRIAPIGRPKPTVDVTFRNKAIPVRVYEIRTGRLLAGTTVQIAGASCPEELTYTTYSYPADPPSDVYVESSPDDVRNAFDALINPAPPPPHS